MDKGVLRQYLAAFIGSLSVMVAGCSYGWVTPLLTSFHDPHGTIPMTHEESSWVVALIEFGNLFTSIPAGLLVDRWGRKPLLLATAPVYIFSWLLVIFTRSALVLYFVRTIQGLAMGVIFTVLPIYLAEISSPDIRGALTTFFEGMWYLGFLFQYVSGPYMSYSSYNLLTMSVPVIFLLTFIWIPESPHFYLINDLDDNAASSLRWLRAKEDIQQELQSIKESLVEEYSDAEQRTRERLKALLIVEVVILTKFMSGISAVLSYSSDMFASSRGSTMSADQYTIVMGIVFLITTIVAGSLVDEVGRRPLLLMSCVGCALAQFVAGLYCLMESSLAGYRWLFLASVMVYCVIFSLGLGPVANTFKGEIFPSTSKGLGSGVTTMTDTISCFLCLKMYQGVTDNFGVFVNFWIFSVFSLFGAIFVYYIVPETKGKTFSEIQNCLNPPGSLTVKKYSFGPCQDVGLLDISYPTLLNLTPDLSQRNLTYTNVYKPITIASVA